VNPVLIVLTSLACVCAISAGGCAGDAGPTSRPFFDPVGTEPSGSAGTEGTIGGQEPFPGDEPGIQHLCADACARFGAICPGTQSAFDCARNCLAAAESAQGCEVQFQAVLSCLITTPLFCEENGLVAPSCDDALADLNACSTP